MPETWAAILLASFRQVAQHLARMTPRVLAMVTLVLAGWAVAAMVRRLVSRALRATRFDARCTRWGLRVPEGRLGGRVAASDLIGHALFWMVFGIGLLMGIDTLEIRATAGLLPTVVGFLPNILVAGLIMLVGWILADFLAQSALIAAVNSQIAGAPLIAAATRWLVLVFAGAAALTQLGIAREMVLLAFGIAFGGTVLTVALAFGLGGKELAREILESRLRKHDEDDAPEQ
jgi:hypothetical protein